MNRSAGIFVYGWFGQSNTGDDAILWSLSSELQRRLPEARLKILTKDECYLPENVRRSASSVNISFFDVLRELTNSKILVFAGGTHITDEGNIRVRRIRAHLAILSLTLWAKLLRIRIAHISIGVGPLNNGLTKLIASVTLRFADFVSVRDQISARRTAELNLRRKVIVTLDVSLLSDPANEIRREEHRDEVGISVLPFMRIYRIGNCCDDIWLQPLSQALSNLASRHKQLRFNIFEFSANDVYGDQEISERLSGEIESANLISIVPYSQNPEQAIQAVSRCSYFLGMRYHSILFSVSRHIPTIVLPYAEKCADLAKEFGLGDSLVEKEKMVDVDYIESKLEDLISNPARYTSLMERAAQIQKSLEGIPSPQVLREWMRE